MSPVRTSRAARAAGRYAFSAILTGAGVTLVAAGLFAYVLPLGAATGTSPSPVPTGTPGTGLAVVSPAPAGSSPASTSPSPAPSPAGAVATRVVIPALKIDLPIVSQATEKTGANGQPFPYCDVAEYATSFTQPGHPGTTYLFAHARVGMFLPLLLASQLNNGEAMIGYTVFVYTSDSNVYWYSVSRVRRHVVPGSPGEWDITRVAGGVQQLVLQTSEGPYNSSTKLQVLARYELVQPASYADSHPTPHPLVCA